LIRIGLLLAFLSPLFLLLKPVSIQPKREAVKLLSLPDLSICNEALFIRYRSLSEVGDIFGISPSLPPYFPSDFTYAPAPYTHALQEIR